MKRDEDDGVMMMRHAQRAQALERQARYEARAETHLRCSLRMAAAQERIAAALERKYPAKPARRKARG